MNTNRIITTVALLIGLFGWSFFVFSCKGNSLSRSSSKAPLNSPQVEVERKDVKDAATTVGEVANSVGVKADSIDKHADSIEIKSTPESRLLVKTDVDGIRTDVEGLRKDKSTLSATEQKLKDTEASLAIQEERIKDYTKFANQTEKERTVLQDKIKDLESSNGKMLKVMLSWITVFCVVGIGASLFIGFVFKTQAAFMIGASCLATMGVAIGVTLYMQQIAWVALIALCVGFISAVIYVFLQIKNRDKAVKELVQTSEIAKNYLTDNAKEKIFGNNVEPGIAHNVQSPSTMKFVSQIRSSKKSKEGVDFSKGKAVNKKQDLPATEVLSGVPKAEKNTQKTILG